MNGKAMTRTTFFLFLAGSMVAASTSGWAQDDPNEAVKAQTDKLKAEAELERARAERDKAGAERISALNLPSFSGETKVEQGAGALEATMLATHALQAAAVEIGRLIGDQAPKQPISRPDADALLVATEDALEAMAVSEGDADGARPAASLPRPVLVLAGGETVDFSEVGLIDAEMWAIRKQFRQTGVEAVASTPNQKFFNLTIGTAVAAASAVAGLLRSETTVSALDLPAVSERALSHAVAAQLGGRAIIPHAAVGPISTNARLIAGLDSLAGLRDQAKERIATLSKTAKSKKANAATIAALAAVTARFDTFFARVTTADAKGSVPVVRAAHLDRMISEKPTVLRVFVDKVGGSLVNTKNINTTFGRDPLRVTGGLVASYALTDPDTGRLLGSRILVCRTAMAKLRAVQDGSWVAANKPAAVCTGGG